jgi:MFS family permease
MDSQVGEEKDFFYGWIVVFVATFALIVSNGLTTLGIAVFSKPIRDEFVSTGIVPQNEAESMIAAAGYLTFLLAGFISPLTGFLIKRISLKWLMAAGCVLLGGALLLHSQATGTLTVYISRIMMGVSLGLVGVMPNVVLVSNWFNKLRGAALGLTLTGTSIGGVVIPLLATPLLLHYGWRFAMIMASLLVWLLLLAIVFLVRNVPQDMDLFPDGEPLSVPGDLGGESAAGVSLGKAMSTPVFWVFGLCAAAVFYTVFMTSQQFVLYLQTPKIGITPMSAGYLISTLFSVSIAGKFLFGWLADRFPPPRIMLICCGMMFVSTFILFNLTAGNALIFVVLFGLGYGGTFVLLQLLVAEFFGRREYGKILGVIVMIETIGAAIGGKVTGTLADADGGDYIRAFYGVIVSTGLALALTLILNRKRIYLAF